MVSAPPDVVTAERLCGADVVAQVRHVVLPEHPGGCELDPVAGGQMIGWLEESDASAEQHRDDVEVQLVDESSMSAWRTTETPPTTAAS